MKAIKKTLVISITVVLAALTFGSCSSDELATTVTPKQEQQQGKTIIMNVHLEASAGQEMPSGDPSTRGLQLKYTQKIPFFTANVDNVTGKKTVQATCVFKRYNKETGKLEDGTEMYGKVIFEQDPKQTAQAITDNLKIISDGKITLTPVDPNLQVKAGDQWYMMGMIGGVFDKDKKTMKCFGFGANFTSNGADTSSNLDTSEGYDIPFLSKWTKLVPITDPTTFSSQEYVHFKAQGMLMKILVKNDTQYKLNLHLAALQSTKLATSADYDLSPASLPNLDSNEYSSFKWTYNGTKDKTGKWMRRNYIFGRLVNNQIDYYIKVDPGKTMQDKDDNSFQTVLVWGNVVNNNLPERTGFYLEMENTEAKPLGATSGSGYKYVYTSDKDFDDLVTKGLTPAPNMNWVLSKVLQETDVNGGKGLASAVGTYITCPIKIKNREVLPAEQMAQYNLYDYKTLKWSTPKNAYDYAQTGAYAKEFAQKSVASSSTWTLPNKEQWTGMFLANDQNPDHAKNFNSNGAQFYDWSEGGSNDAAVKAKAKESIQMGDGIPYTYYSVYQRFPGGTPESNEQYPNNKYIYALRFFQDVDQKIGSKHFCLMKYEYSKTKTDEDAMTINTIYLGPLFMKLYAGMYNSTQELLKEIGLNDNGTHESMFYNYANTMVSRTMTLRNAKFNSYKYAATAVNTNPSTSFTAGYFIGPADKFPTNNTAYEYSFRGGVVYDGYSKSHNANYSNYTTLSLNTVGYIRPINTKFTAFQYKP